MLEQGPISLDKMALPNSSSLYKPAQERSQLRIQDEGSKWKSKSLNSLPTQHYEMDVTKTIRPKQQKTTKKSQQYAKQSKAPQGGQKLLPQPKIKKINQKMFCVTIDNQINVFYLTDEKQRNRSKNKKNSFGQIRFQLGDNIKFAAGNGSNYIFLGTENYLVIVQMQRRQDKYFIVEKSRKQIPRLRAVTFIGQQIIAVSSEQVYQYSLNSNLDLLAKKTIQFQNEHDRKLFNELKSIDLVVESIFCFYFFGAKVQEKTDFNSKRKFNPDAAPPVKMCQVLHIVKFIIQHNLQNVEMHKNELQKGQDLASQDLIQIKKSRYMSQTQIALSKISSIKIQLYLIDQVFETGIFDKSKIYELDENMFIMSLHQEIIIIKKHFKKFIVWDNVSIVSSKSQQKKGQLILADKRILVYSQNGEIFAHDIYFSYQESRLNMPTIDSFRGNDNDEEILYDAVLLEYDKNSLMKVLFYFKDVDIILPNKSKFRKQPDNPNDPQHDEDTLHFTMLCINQSDPQEKLKQMLRLKKPPNEIGQFCQRFNIKPLEKTKCMWSVSEKSLKDIQNVLLQISDDSYIQTQLDNILKKQPHNLTFLITVEKKQIARLKKLIVKNLLNDNCVAQIQIFSQGGDPKKTEQKRREYVEKIIQWLMQSIMFEKKLQYSKNFLSFKEYDFIQIGKLKAASLKEQIKLLSCKKYQKRLKYFLNSFKVLAIANWEQIFQFLLVNKNQTQIKQFLIDFNFILPRFVQTSAVFQKRNNFSLYADPNKSLAKNQSRTEKVNSDDQKCRLWDDLTQILTILEQALLNAGQQKISHTQQILNTIQDFQQMIIKNIQALKKDPKDQAQAIHNFKQVLRQVTVSKWFQTAAFKQHSMLNKISKQLQQQFLQLKNKKAYQILVKYLYKQIQQGKVDITVSGVNKMLDDFVIQPRLRIPQSFKKNDDARIQVYAILQSKKYISKSGFNMKKSDYLVMNEDVYFNLLFNQIRSQILKSVKGIYDNIQQGFFRQRFQIFLKSKLVDLLTIINFLDEFEGTNADQVRLDVFNCIKRLLRLSDYENTRDFIQKSLDKQVLPQRSNDMQNSSVEMNLRQQAKIPYGFVFYHFFKIFDLEYTYQQLIQATQNANLISNHFLKQLIRKYCSTSYQSDTGYYGNKQCLIEFQDNKILNQKLSSVDIYNRPLQFFGILLYLVDILDFHVQEKQLYELMIQNYLNQGKLGEQKCIQTVKREGIPIMMPALQMFRNDNSGGIVYENKFQQLWSFVKSIENYIMTGEDLHTKNYVLINDFKDEHDPEQVFVDYAIQWIQRKYGQIQSKQQIEATLVAIKKVLQILQKSRKSTKRIKQVGAFYRLLQFLKRFNIQIMMKIMFIKEQLQHYSGFIFLIHMFRQVGVQNFITANLEQESKGRNNENQNEYESPTVIKKMPTSFETNTKIYNWMCIFSQYKIIKGEENIDDKDNPEFIRFIVQICCIMVSENKYEIAWDLLMRAVNQTYYFRDSFYYLASQIKIQNRNQFRDSFRALLSTQTAKNLKSKLNNMIKGNMEQMGGPGKVLSFPPQRLVGSSNSQDKKQMLEGKHKNALFIFQELLESNRADEAFYFLVRIKRIHNKQVEGVSKSAKRLSPLGLNSYLLLTSYMKCLEKYIANEFYPTFLFFKSKFQILIDQMQKKDIIKDINIAISRLKDRLQQQRVQVLRKDIAQSKAQLKHYYCQYMQHFKEDPQIKLTQQDEEQATRRIQMYARHTPQNMLDEELKQQKQAKFRLLENQQKLQKVHENNKLNVIHKEIQESVTQAKKAADKYAAILEEKKRQATKATYAEKKQQELLEIKRKEEEEVSSIKDSFKSNTTQKVNELIEQLRRKREKINQSRYKSSMIRQEEQKRDIIIPHKDVPGSVRRTQQLQQSPQSMKNIQAKNVRQGNTLEAYGVGNRSSQIIENARRSYVEGQPKPSQKFLQIQQKMRKAQQPTASKSKISLQQIRDLLKSKQPEALKYLQKFELIKQNMQVGVQLAKRVYSVTKDLSNFLQFMRYLFGFDDRYREVLEQKSIGIVGQMIKMDQKINLKDLIPVEMFTQVHQGASLKDYYNAAYEIIKPNLRKILGEQRVAAHALGILMRYSLGSETKYFHRVFADYISTLLKAYQKKAYDEKQTFLLAQKLRSQFSNLEPDNRQFIFEKLVNEVTDEAKIKKLLNGLRRAIQRKTDSAISGGQNEQISRAIARLDRQ